jgi:hypothetical protein
MAITPNIPIYYGGTAESLADDNGENNPLDYATESFWSDGYLACYSRPLLLMAGVEIRNLAETTSRNDNQIMMIGRWSLIETAKIAVITIRNRTREFEQI